MPATFILVRHAEGTHNLAAETFGEIAYRDPLYRDARLTTKGVLQARATGNLIAAEWPNAVAVWSSPLTRCIQTATHIMESVSVREGNKFVHDYLIERQRKEDVCNFRADANEISSAWPMFKTQFLSSTAGTWDEDEPQDTVKMRVTMLLEHLNRKYKSGTVIIVSHYETLFEVVGRGLNNAEFVVWEQG
jgi:broad specificity phosphatase PhoE